MSAETVEWNSILENKPKVSTAGGEALKERAVKKRLFFLHSDISSLREGLRDFRLLIRVFILWHCSRRLS